MTTLSLQLSRAVARGRAATVRPASRAALLHALLRKRAVAHVHGADDLEALLRDQIRWALPMLSGQAPPDDCVAQAISVKSILTSSPDRGSCSRDCGGLAVEGCR